MKKTGGNSAKSPFLSLLGESRLFCLSFNPFVTQFIHCLCLNASVSDVYLFCSSLAECVYCHRGHHPFVLFIRPPPFLVPCCAVCKDPAARIVLPAASATSPKFKISLSMPRFKGQCCAENRSQPRVQRHTATSAQSRRGSTTEWGRVSRRPSLRDNQRRPAAIAALGHSRTDSVISVSSPSLAEIQEQTDRKELPRRRSFNAQEIYNGGLMFIVP